jgi:hypothetical protein
MIVNNDWVFGRRPSAYLKAMPEHLFGATRTTVNRRKDSQDVVMF